MIPQTFDATAYQLNNNGKVAGWFTAQQDASSSDEFLNVGTGPTVDCSGTKPFALECWFMLTTIEQVGGFYSLMTCAGEGQAISNSIYANMGSETNSVQLYLAFGKSSYRSINLKIGGWIARAPIDLKLYTWYHVAVSFPGGDFTGVTLPASPPIYINGQAIDTGNFGPYVYDYVTYPWFMSGSNRDWRFAYQNYTQRETWIGSFGIGPQWPRGNFPGAIANYRVWNTARTEQEFASNRFTSLPSGTSGLIISPAETPPVAALSKYTTVQTNISDSNTLLVPVYLDALLVNDDVLGTGGNPAPVKFNRSTVDCEEVIQFKNQSEAFNTSNSTPPQKGVYLHWALPDGLTNGTQQADGSVQFPLVPNRWLVIRSCTSNPGAWVVESDYLNATDGTNSFVDPSSAGKTPQVTKIGKSTDFASWSEPTSKPNPFLTAEGPNGAYFSAYQPGSENVFSFHDPLTNVAAQNISYIVVGWYSDSGIDILNSYSWTNIPGWEALMNQLEWTVDMPPAQLSRPTSSLYHGITTNLAWQLSGAPESPATDLSASNTNLGSILGSTPALKVAVGNTAVEALATMLEDEAAAVRANVNAHLVGFSSEVIDFNLLDDLNVINSSHVLSKKLHRESYNTLPGGTLFQTLNDTDSPLGYAIPTAVNQAAAAANQSNANAAIITTQMYLRWWYYNYIVNQGQTPDMDNILYSLYWAGSQKGGFYEALRPDPANEDAVKNYFAWQSGLPSDKELKAVNQPAFHTPAEPVLLITGLNRSRKHGEDGRYTQDGKLYCRSSVNFLNGNNQTALTWAQGFVKAGIPAQVQAVLAEAYYLNPQNGISDTTALINQIQTGFAPNTAPSVSGISGYLPCPLGVLTWQQAWAPLFLDWKVKWYQTKQASLGKWTSGGSTEFTFSGDSSDLLAANTFSGRTHLTPNTMYAFGDSLKKFLKERKMAGSGSNTVENELSELSQDDQNRIDNVLAWMDTLWEHDVMAQSLGGLYDQLITQEHRLSLDPYPIGGGGLPSGPLNYEGYNNILVGRKNSGGGVVPMFETTTDNPNPWFYPVRAGFFYFEALEVVDCFGQTVNLLEANENTAGTPDQFNPLVQDSLKPPTALSFANAKYAVAQPPRIIQGSRLNFELIDTANENNLCKVVDGANPISGFLLPNHLDSSFMVYDNTGAVLGEVVKQTNGTTVQAVWLQPPGGNSTIATASDIPDANLKAVITQLVRAGNDGSEFDDFLSVIDSTLWSVDPLGGRADQHLSVLIGRPIALVRASLSYELYGRKVKTQLASAWSNAQPTAPWDTVATDPYDYSQEKYPVRLGQFETLDDGLIGYWNPTCDLFYSVHPDAGSTYIQPIDSSSYLQLGFDGKSQNLTMLVDPRGSVHATSGLLPTKALIIPEAYIKSALEQMAVTFRIGPLLTDAKAIRMPQPKIEAGQWSWLQQTAGNSWQSEDVIESSDIPADDDTNVIREGWLKLSPEGNG